MLNADEVCLLRCAVRVEYSLSLICQCQIPASSLCLPWVDPTHTRTHTPGKGMQNALMYEPPYTHSLSLSVWGFAALSYHISVVVQTLRGSHSLHNTLTTHYSSKFNPCSPLVGTQAALLCPQNGKCLQYELMRRKIRLRDTRGKSLGSFEWKGIQTCWGVGGDLQYALTDRLQSKSMFFPLIAIPISV